MNESEINMFSVCYSLLTLDKYKKIQTMTLQIMSIMGTQKRKSSLQKNGKSSEELK